MNSQYAQQQHYGYPNSAGYPGGTPSMQPQPGVFNPAQQLRPNASSPMMKPGIAAQGSPMLLPNMRQPGQEYDAYNGQRGGPPSAVNHFPRTPPSNQGGMSLGNVGSGAHPPTSQMAGLNLGQQQQQQMLVGPAGDSPMSHMKPVAMMASPMPPQHNIGPVGDGPAPSIKSSPSMPPQHTLGSAGDNRMPPMKPVGLPASPMPPNNIGPAGDGPMKAPGMMVNPISQQQPNPMLQQHHMGPGGDAPMQPMKPQGMMASPMSQQHQIGPAGDGPMQPMKPQGMMASPMAQQHHIGPAGDGPMQKPQGMMGGYMQQQHHIGPGGDAGMMAMKGLGMPPKNTSMLAGPGGDVSMMTPPKVPSLNGAHDNRQQYVNGSPTCQSPGMMLPPMGQQQQQPAMLGAQQHHQPAMAGGHMLPQQQLAGPPYMPHAQPGMPPMQPKPTYPPQQPGRMAEQYPGQHMQQSAYQQQPQQSRRLDPEQMPSPIQVMLEDQKAKLGPFVTNQRGQVPPLVTTNFVTRDEGNANPRFIRASMYSVPATIDMMKQTAVPFGLVISPLADLLPEEQPPPIVDMGESGPVRCIRCKAYMCPLMQFVDGGRRFHCLLCKATSEVPPEYFQHLDHMGQRVDRYQRPELMLGAYEYVATKDYCRNNVFPKPPALIFLIDVSYNNMKSGMVNLLCQEMRNILSNLPKDQGQEKSNMRVGFITYSNAVHFYNIKGTLAQPKMMVVGDTHDMFMPLLDGFLCEPATAEDMIDSLMQEIPKMFAETRETETILAPAIQAGLEALKASECAGKLLVFHSSLPIAEAPGKLKNRDDRKLLGTDKEKTVLSPQTTFYNNLGQDCVAAGCSVDLFVLNNSYVDLATISQVSRLTGGQVYKYTYFQADVDGPRLIADITRNISRNIAFDAIMRVRTSTGVRPTEFFGHFFMSNTTDMELASIDSDKAVAVEIKHDDKLTEEDGVFIQVALLYTSCGGQRRLRVLNLALKTCLQMADLYRGCDLDTIVNFFSKQAIMRLLESAPKPVKDGLVNRCAQMLACYRKNCANPSSAGQLILPECMKLLPLYVNCILKSDALAGGSEMTLDDRSFTMCAVTTMDIPTSVVYFYPRLLPLHDLDPASTELPAPIRCSSDKLRDDGVYLLENGIHMFLWVGANVSLDWSRNVFGEHIAATIDIARNSLPNFDNPVSQRLRYVIEIVRSQRQRSMKLTIIPQRDKLELVFKYFLVEDRGMDGSASYVDFLCHMHKEIRNLLS